MAKEELKSFVQRIERLEEEKKALADDIRSIYAEAEDNGFDMKALRTVIRMRKQDAKEREAQQAIVDTYLVALGMLSDTPLGRSAVERAVASPGVRRAFKKMGKPVELTDEEKAKGFTAAFVKNGHRMAVGAVTAD
jgi:uncharacterized protein (UPF0335 family)